MCYGLFRCRSLSNQVWSVMMRIPTFLSCQSGNLLFDVQGHWFFVVASYLCLTGKCAIVTTYYGRYKARLIVACYMGQLMGQQAQRLRVILWIASPQRYIIAHRDSVSPVSSC